MHTASTKAIRVSLHDPVTYQYREGQICLILYPIHLSEDFIAKLESSVKVICVSFEETIPQYHHDTAMMILAEESSKFEVICVRADRPTIWLKPEVARTWSSALSAAYWNGTIDSVLDDILSDRNYASLELFGELEGVSNFKANATSPPRVVFFSPYGSWLVHNQFDALIGAAVRLRGAEVLVVRCDGFFGNECYVLSHSKDKEQDCKNCIAIGDDFFRSFSLPSIQIRDSVPDDLRETVLAWVNSLKENELSTCKYKEYSVGSIVTPHVCSRFRITPKSLGMSDVKKAHRSMLFNSILTYEACKNIYTSWKPDQVIMFNGGGFAHGAAYHCARNLGISVLTHERGYSDDTFLVVDNATCGSPVPSSHVASSWSNIPMNEAEFNRIEEFFDNREKGKDLNFRPFYEFQTDHVRVREVLRIPKHAKIVSIFTSSAYELFYWPAYKKIERQIEFFDLLIEIFRNRPEYLVIRHHPAMSGNFGAPPQFEFILEAYKQCLDLPENVRIIMPNEELTSYALIWNSAACIAPISTVAIEALARGVPTAVVDVSPLRLAFFEVLVELTKSEIEKVLDRLLTRSEDDKCADLKRLYRVVNGMYFKYSNKFASFGIDTSTNGHSIRINSLDQLADGMDETLDRVCNHIFYGSSVYNLPKAIDKKRDGDEESRLIKRKFDEIQSYRKGIAESSSVKSDPCKILAYLPGPLNDEGVLIRSLAGQRLKLRSAFELPELIRTAGELKFALEHSDSDWSFVFFPSSRIQYDNAFLSSSQHFLEADNSLVGLMWGGWIQGSQGIECSIFGKDASADSFRKLVGPGFESCEALSLCVFRRAFVADWASSVSGGTDVTVLLQNCLESDKFKRLRIPLSVLHCNPVSAGVHDFSSMGIQFSLNATSDPEPLFKEWVAETVRQIEEAVSFLSKGEFGQAKEKLACLVAVRSDIPALYYLMAVASFQLGNFSEAKQLVQMFLRREPANQEGISLLNAIESRSQLLVKG